MNSQKKMRHKRRVAVFISGPYRYLDKVLDQVDPTLRAMDVEYEYFIHIWNRDETDSARGKDGSVDEIKGRNRVKVMINQHPYRAMDLEKYTGRNPYIKAHSPINANHHIVATIGVDNLIVVDTSDATFIATQDKAQEVKSLVESLQSDGRDEGVIHRKVYRPWGWYDSIESGKNFQVKRLHVNPGAELSLQMHHKRAEHWVVVSGEATVVNGEETLTLKEGESTYIPIGATHSLGNKTNELLEVIEVQSGIYLGEDDIVRFKDIYGRSKG